MPIRKTGNKQNQNMLKSADSDAENDLKPNTHNITASSNLSGALRRYGARGQILNKGSESCPLIKCLLLHILKWLIALDVLMNAWRN